MADHQVVCSISFLKKRPDITHEEFYHHWEKIHGPLVKPWMEKHGILSYTQFSTSCLCNAAVMNADSNVKIHSTPAMNKAATPVGPESSSANPLLDYDGAAFIEVASMEVLTTAFQDEYYTNVIAEDEKKFLDKKAGVLRTRGESKKIIKFL